MSDVIARMALGVFSGQPLSVFRGYLQSTGPLVVQLTGDNLLTELEYVGVAGSLVVGPVLLWTPEPGVKPLILGNLNT